MGEDVLRHGRHQFAALETQIAQRVIIELPKRVVRGPGLTALAAASAKPAGKHSNRLDAGNDSLADAAGERPALTPSAAARLDAKQIVMQDPTPMRAGRRTGSAVSIRARRKVEGSFHSAIDVRENFARDVDAVLGEHWRLRFARASALREAARCDKSIEYRRLY